MSVLGRYEVENYLVDPLNVWTLLHFGGKVSDIVTPVRPPLFAL